MINRCVKVMWPTIKVAVMKEVVKVAKVQLKGLGIWDKVRGTETLIWDKVRGTETLIWDKVRDVKAPIRMIESHPNTTASV